MEHLTAARGFGTDRHFHLGAAVRCLDGKGEILHAGILHALVVDSPAFTVTFLVFHPDTQRRDAMLVPIDQVVVPFADRVVIGGPGPEATGNAVVREEAVYLSQDSLIEAEGKMVGMLDCVLMAPESHRVTSLIAHRGAVVGYDVVIPASWIQSIRGRRVVLKATGQDLARLEHFVTHRAAANRACVDPAS